MPPLPWREGMKGRGIIFHPHPNPLLSRERGNLYERS